MRIVLIHDDLFRAIAIYAALKSAVWSATLGVLLLFTGYAQATIFYSSGPANFVGPGVDLGIAVGAEFFTLSGVTTIRAAQFYATGPLQLWDGTLNYFFFNNDGVFPAASPLSTGTNPPFTQTILTRGLIRFDFDLITPLTLPPGTYWLGIQTDLLFDPGGLSWASTTTPYAQLSAAAIQGDFSQWTLQGCQLAFALWDTPLVVPEPTITTLIGLGLTAALWRPKKVLKKL
jgi:hypothetical protein